MAMSHFSCLWQLCFLHDSIEFTEAKGRINQEVQEPPKVLNALESRASIMDLGLSLGQL